MSTTTQQQNVSAMQKQATQEPDFGMTTYTVAGQEVKLSFQTVRKYLVRGNASATDAEVVLFIAICKFNQLNPFLNEAYLVKFGGQAQMIVSKEALMKRAESCPEYDGFRAGLIIKRGNEIIDIEGSFLLVTDVLLGGWAEVHRKDKKFPYVSRVSLAEYDKKQSTWNDKKSTMIRKTAIVQAMREAFPVQLGAMYTAEEQGIQEVPYVDVTDKVKEEIDNNANAGKPIGFEQPTEPVSEENNQPKGQQTTLQQAGAQATTTENTSEQSKMPGF
ncbi:MAG: phage recombination protein Bet [Prevotellaceae bacterium]|jgi:phage recombination protein Bet|nr:phage recombination protein Bet [Prevotellaceae bacterium]